MRRVLIDTTMPIALNRIEDTRKKVAIGIAELDRGEGVDGPTIMNQMLERFQQARESSEP
jgi:antitoxin ParD1/3/4